MVNFRKNTECSQEKPANAAEVLPWLVPDRVRVGSIGQDIGSASRNPQLEIAVST